MRKLRALLPFFVFLAGCSTRISTRHIKPFDAVFRDEGIHYYLPRTVVRVSIPVAETTSEPGAYTDLAPLFFPYLDPSKVLGKRSSYSVDPNKISFVSKGVRDPKHHYLVNPTGDWWADTAFKFSLGDDGVVNKFDITVENRSVDLALTVAEVAAGLASKIATGGVAGSVDVTELEKKTLDVTLRACPFYEGAGADMSADQKNRFKNISPRFRDLYCYLFPEDRDDVFTSGFQAVLLSYVEPALTALPGDKQALRKPPASTKVRKFLSARSLIDELNTIQSNNASFLNEPPRQTTADVWKAVQDSRVARIKEILRQFLGTKVTDPAFALAAFEIDLDETIVSGAKDLFNFSPDEGICAVSGDSGGLKIVSTLPLVSCIKPVVQISLSYHRLGSAPTPSSDSAPIDSGIRYRIPGQGALEVTQATAGKPPTELGRTLVDVAQYGSIASLPRKTGGLKTQYAVELNPSTGALRDITVGNKSMITSDGIKRVGGLAGTAIDTKRALNPAAPAPVSAQATAEKERKLKEEQLRILLLNDCIKDPTKSGCADLVKPQ